MKRIAILMLALTPLVGSAFAKRKPEPEPALVEIKAPVPVVKAVLLKGLLSHGLALENETEHQITVSQPMPTALYIISQLLETPSACQAQNPPKYIFIFNLVALTADSTFVSVTAATEHAGALCHTVRQSLDGGKLRATLGNRLAELKEAAERTAVVPASAPVTTPAVVSAPVPQPAPALQPEPVVPTPQPESLGDAARRVRAAKEAK